MADVYEVVHTKGVDFEARARMIVDIAQAHKRSDGTRLLDVACGTGRLLASLNPFFSIEGLDGSPEMIKKARAQLPAVPFHRADMSRFRSRHKYDVITCLGGSLCYSQSLGEFHRVIRTMATLLRPGGILIVDCCLQPEQYPAMEALGVWRIDVDEADRKISVLRRAERDGTYVVLEYNYLVASAAGASYFKERHHLSMFTTEQNLDAFVRNGLQPTNIPDPDAIFRGHSIYVAVKE
jgi:SAM-dependent methyltransferase